MNTISLTRILFEGLIKVPLVLYNKIKDDVSLIVASKYYSDSKNASQGNNFIEQVEKDRQHFKSIKSSLQSKILNLGMHDLKSKDFKSKSSKEKEIFLDAPSIFAIYYQKYFSDYSRSIINRIHILTEVADENDEQEISVTFFKDGEKISSFKEKKSYFESELSFNLDFITNFDYAISYKQESLEDIEEFKKYIEENFGKNNLIDRVSNVFSRSYMLTDSRYFEGWRPGNTPIDLSKVVRLNTGEPVTLLVKITFHKSQDLPKWSGTYDGKVSKNFHLINIALKSPSIFTKNKLEAAIEEVGRTVYHELGHFVQDLLQQSVKGYSRADSSERFGYPSRKISQPEPEFTPEGKWTHEHPLRDIEFYTNLTNIRSKIDKKLSKVESKEIKILLFKKIVGMKINPYDENIPIGMRYLLQDTDVNEKMEVLLNKNPEKWAKAVKELYKSLDSHFSENVPSRARKGKNNR